MADLKPNLCPESEQELIEESVADVVMYDPRCELVPQAEPHKIIDGSVTFMRDAPLGMRMYPETYVRRVLESRDNLARELAPLINGRTFMGEPVLPERAISHPAPVQAEQSLEVVAWNLECQTLGGDTGWILSWSRSGAGLCNRLSGVEHEVALTDHAKATAALAQKGAEIERLTLELMKANNTKIENSEAALMYQIADLRAQLAEVQKDADRGRFMIKHGSWHRGEEQTHLSVLVPQGSDLSCYATREACIDAAMQSSQEKV